MPIQVPNPKPTTSRQAILYIAATIRAPFTLAELQKGFEDIGMPVPPDLHSLIDIDVKDGILARSPSVTPVPVLPPAPDAKTEPERWVMP